MNIRVLRSARRTIADGIRFYDRQEAGLGAYFLSSVMSDLRSLKVFGGVHQIYEGTPFHRMVCKRFPFSVYYLKENDEIQIYAVLDDRRDPARLRKLLRDLGLES